MAILPPSSVGSKPSTGYLSTTCRCSHPMFACVRKSFLVPRKPDHVLVNTQLQFQSNCERFVHAGSDGCTIIPRCELATKFRIKSRELGSIISIRQEMSQILMGIWPGFIGVLKLRTIIVYCGHQIGSFVCGWRNTGLAAFHSFPWNFSPTQ